MRPGLVIGNGESRLALPLADLIASGAYEVAACNKAALDFPGAQHVVCVDDRMRKWLSARMDPKRVLYRPYQKSGYASGPSALGLLARLGCPTVLLAGFDVWWTPDAGRRANNVYKGTEGYVKAEAHNQNNLAQTEQVAAIMSAFPALRVYQLGVLTMHPDVHPPRKWKGNARDTLMRIGLAEIAPDGSAFVHGEGEKACAP
ncbi:MAG TPA: hypothetical protein VJP77_05540 [Planctomycetota bacterium]|nr:hypothetical protein [Planctomycetota bacterium]